MRKELDPKDSQYLRTTVRGITTEPRISPDGKQWKEVYINGDLGLIKPFPDKTGDLQFIKELGYGGQGDIYLVKTSLSPSEIRKIPPLHREKFQGEKPFVLKVSKPGTDLAVLEREIEVLSQADGQYLPRLIAYSVHNANLQGTEKQVFILEEYLAAQELKKAIHEGLKKPLPLDLALKIIVNTASALDYLINQKRLLKAYCDLDPTQIFFNRRGKVSFCDPAGSVRLVQIADKNKYGKIVYAAPELYDPKSKPNEQTDMFALSVILWEALTGIDPHDPVNQYPPDFFVGKHRPVALSVFKNQLLQRYGSSRLN